MARLVTVEPVAFVPRKATVEFWFTTGWLAQSEDVDGPIVFRRPVGTTLLAAIGAQIGEAARTESSLLAAMLDPAPLCTGVTATWCPVHGDCTCPPDPDPLYLNADGCPLHDTASAHPRPTQEA